MTKTTTVVINAEATLNKLLQTHRSKLRDPQGLTVKEACPWTCLRAGQSRVAITRVLPTLSGMKVSDQTREDCLGIRLKAENS